ncbi:MAG: type IV secretion system DNA-binding domain-containing protein [Patescibacteria group bacterium]|nr:type IV secretion system DNA-binding domain-containing protein [Patescibacteria group bacterium]
MLMVLVPKESLKSETKEGGALSKAQEGIAVAETFLSAIGGLRTEKGLWAWLTGKRQSFSFEIVAQNGLISFYVGAPSHRKDFIEEQIHAQYPSAQIEEVKDYNIFTSRGNAAGAYMVFSRPGVFPIKTYKKLETDPLNSITNALSKIEKQDGGAIQLLVRPAHPGWRGQGKHIVSEVQKGKKLNVVLSENLLLEIFKTITSFFRTEDKKTEPEKPHQPSQMEQEMLKGIEEKMSKAGFETNIRIVASAPTYERAKMYVDNIVDAFGQYSIYEYGNAFRKMFGNQEDLIKSFIYRNFHDGRKIMLNTEEVASVFHFPLPTTETPNIKWLVARSAEPPSNMAQKGIILGRNMYRAVETPVRMDDEARRRHLYSVGQTGTGKSTFLQELIKQDIKAGRGVCVIDPHGDLVEDVIGCVPRERIDDVIYYNPADIERPMGLNLLEFDPKYPEQKTFVINELISIFDKLFDLKATGGPMFEQYMRNAILLIMDHVESGSTLMEIPKVLADEKFRKFKLEHCSNQTVKDFWTQEAEKAGGEAALSNVTPYVTSKLTQFISNDIMRPIISQQKSSFNLREIMDDKKILFLNLSKGKIGDFNAYLLGMVLVGKIWAAALSRVDTPQAERHDFYLYIDEFQNFTTDTIASILSEARKYRLCLNITHQFIGQLVKDNDTRIRDAVFGNVGNMISFRVGPEDGEFMEQQFAPVFNKHDLINVSNFNAYVKIIIEEQVSRPFNMEIYRHWNPWHEKAERMFGLKGDEKIASAIKQMSRIKYGRDKGAIELEIKRRSKLI